MSDETPVKPKRGAKSDAPAAAPKRPSPGKAPSAVQNAPASAPAPRGLGNVPAATVALPGGVSEALANRAEVGLELDRLAVQLGRLSYCSTKRDAQNEGGRLVARVQHLVAAVVAALES